MISAVRAKGKRHNKCSMLKLHSSKPVLSLSKMEFCHLNSLILSAGGKVMRSVNSNAPSLCILFALLWSAFSGSFHWKTSILQYIATQTQFLERGKDYYCTAENKHVQTTHTCICPTGQEKMPPASASNLANPPMSFQFSKSAEKLAAHQEQAVKKRAMVITDIMACRFMLLKIWKWQQ